MPQLLQNLKSMLTSFPPLFFSLIYIVINEICRSSSFLARLKAVGGGGASKQQGGDEYTGLRSLMHTMNKDAKQASSHSLLVDEGT